MTHASWKVQLREPRVRGQRCESLKTFEGNGKQLNQRRGHCDGFRAAGVRDKRFCGKRGCG